jgi:hypothetical protein
MPGWTTSDVASKTNLDKWAARKVSATQRHASAIDAAFGGDELSVATGSEWQAIEELLETSDEDAVCMAFDE